MEVNAPLFKVIEYRLQRLVLNNHMTAMSDIFPRDYVCASWL